jgi:pimeloyl-ACP methyl ester carboxylesterase
MNPFFFGAAPRRLYGLYQPGRSALRQSRALVFCYPWGSEYLHAHRALRQLAKMLAAEGIHSLRFDYFGTGDSAGETIEPNLGGCVSDIESAIDELLHTANCTQVTLLGLRLGGALAAMAAEKNPSRVGALVLWDPVMVGAEYLDGLWAANLQAPRIGRAPPGRPVEVGGGHEVLGFPLTSALQEEIRALSLAPVLARLPVPTLLIKSQVSSSPVPPRADGSSSTSHIETEIIPDLHPWIERDPANAGAVPAKILKRIAQWLA